MKRVASVNTMTICEDVPRDTVSQRKQIDREGAIRESVQPYGMELFNYLEVPREGSPFLTNNYAMYDFNDGEFLGSSDIMGFGL